MSCKITTTTGPKVFQGAYFKICNIASSAWRQGMHEKYWGMVQNDFKCPFESDPSYSLWAPGRLLCYNKFHPLWQPKRLRLDWLSVSRILSLAKCWVSFHFILMLRWSVRAGLFLSLPFLWVPWRSLDCYSFVLM